MKKIKAVNSLLSVFIAATMVVQGLCTPVLARTVNINRSILAPNGSNITLSDSFSFDGTNYVMTIDVGQNSASGGYIEATNFAPVTVVSVSSGSSSYTVTESGWYAIQVHGGNGGNGGNAYSTKNGVLDQTGYGGTGGEGYNATVYKKFNAGDVIGYSVGTNGSKGSDHTKEWGITDKAIAHGGTAGTYSSISVNSTNVILAGGGGGGGGGAAGQSFDNGGSPGNSHNSADSYNNAISYKRYSYSTPVSRIATAGGDAYVGIGAKGGSAGDNGYYFVNSMFSTNSSGLNNQGSAATNFNNLSSLTSAGVVITCLETDAHLSGGSDFTMQDLKDNLASSLQGFSLSTNISDYFDVTDVSINNNGSLSHSMSGNTLNITNINPTISYTGDTTPASSSGGFSNYTVTANGNFTITVKLTPKSGFLGGNDVPLTTSAVTLSKGSSTETCGGATNVNVAIPNPTLEVTDITIDCGDSATKGDMITSVTTDQGDWKSDFVTITNTNGADTISPTATTEYELFVKIAPATVVPISTIGNVATEQSETKTATCYVNYSVNFALTNMEAKSSETVDGTSDYNTTIVPSDGYLLPDTVIITVAGETLDASSYTYDNASGSITIPKDFITGNIVIGAEAPADKLDLTYSYEVPADGDTFDTETYVEAYVAGETIDKTFINDFVPEAVEGYSFAWDWNTTDNVPLNTMPDEAWTVTGRYSINDYKLTVTYVYAEGSTPVTPSPTPYEEDVTYKETYSVTSPTIEGYTPDIEVVSGTMGGEAKNVTVTYTPNPHNLKIIYKLADTGEVYDTYEHTYGTDEAYNVTSLRITGYEPNVAAVTGTMGLENVEVTVTYSLKEYTLTIKYLDSDDEDNPMIDPATGLAIPDYVEQVPYKGIYSVTSPIIANHQCSDETVEGEMGASSLTVCVYYSDSIVSIIVEWGDLVYDLTYDNAWDPEGHTYGDNKVTLTPETEGQNFIKVTNNSTSLDVNIALSYSAATEFSTLDGWFTGSAADATKITGYELDAGGKSNKVYLWLGGTLENTSSKEFISGQVTVTISGGN